MENAERQRGETEERIAACALRALYPPRIIIQPLRRARRYRDTRVYCSKGSEGAAAVPFRRRSPPLRPERTARSRRARSRVRSHHTVLVSAAAAAAGNNAQRQSEEKPDLLPANETLHCAQTTEQFSENSKSCCVCTTSREGSGDGVRIAEDTLAGRGPKFSANCQIDGVLTRVRVAAETNSRTLSGRV